MLQRENENLNVTARVFYNFHSRRKPPVRRDRRDLLEQFRSAENENVFNAIKVWNIPANLTKLLLTAVADGKNFAISQICFRKVREMYFRTK